MIAEFLGKLQVLDKAFNNHSKKSTVREPRRSVGKAIVMVDKVLKYVTSCLQKARKLQSLARETTDGPEGTFNKQVFEVIGTDGTIASQDREKHQSSVFISRVRDELERGITADFECREPTCCYSF